MKIEIELTKDQVAQVVAKAHAEQAVGQAVQDGLRPGQVVADVGGNADEPAYTGTLNPDTLDRLDWAWYQANKPLLKVGEYELFSHKPYLGDRATGYTYTPGDLATADLSGYYVAGSKFAAYL